MRPKRDNKSMTTRAFIGTMAAGAMAVFLAPLVASQDAGTKPLNVVFISRHHLEADLERVT